MSRAVAVFLVLVGFRCRARVDALVVVAAPGWLARVFGEGVAVEVLVYRD